MSNVRLRLGHRVALSGQPSNDCNAGAMKAQMGQADALEELMPFFGGIFRKLDQVGALLSPRDTEQRQQISVQRSSVHAAAFGEKHYRSGLGINVGEGNGGLGQPASLAHRNKPAITHPLIAGRQFPLDPLLFIARNFRLLFRAGAFQAKPQAWIRGDVTAFDRLLQDRRENLQLCESGIERTASNDFSGWRRAKLRIIDADSVSHLQRRNNFAVLQVCREGGPRAHVTSNRFRIGKVAPKKLRHPSVKSMRTAVLVELGFVHGVLCHHLFDLSKRAVALDADAGSLVAPRPVCALILEIIEGTGLPNVVRSHVVVQHSAANQNPSMTNSRGK